MNSLFTPNSAPIANGCEVPDDAGIRDVFEPFPSVDRPKEDQSGLTSGFPILTQEWRIAEPHPLAVSYCSVVDCDFSLANLQKVIRDGTALMLEVGGFVIASRHVQELQIRKQYDDRLYLESQRRHFPAIAEEIDEIFRIGVCPPFEHARWSGTESGFPHDRSKTGSIIESLWKDIRACKVIVVATGEIPAHERTESCPTHTPY